MIIIDFLEENAKKYTNEECLVEINPQKKPERYRTWREFALIEPITSKEFRRSITWGEFDTLANKFANLFTKALLDAANIKYLDETILSKVLEFDSDSTEAAVAKNIALFAFLFYNSLTQ